MQLGQLPMPYLEVQQALGDHAHDLGPGRQRRVRRRTHQADIAPTVDQAPAPLADQPTQGLRGRPKGR